MEQARLVRQALARAIDRDEINEVIVGGLGYAVPNPYFDPNNSRWDAKWDYPFDPAEAESLLAQAGYPNGYEQPLYVRPENATSVEVAEAVSGYWRDIGLDVPVISYAYSAFRPSVVGRTQTVPWLSTCDEGTNGVPWDWPKAKVMSSITRGGFGCGQESPEIAQWYLEAAAEPDPLVREQINDEVLDYLQNWALNPGTVAIPILAVINPNAIESWDQHTTIRQTITDWDNIVPAN
jgi:ABC-type transport system substrate-binding protein